VLKTTNTEVYEYVCKSKVTLMKQALTS